MRVATVFGGSTPRESDPAYIQAQELGRRLAEAGWAVATGAYSGTMEAVSRGAAEAGGHTIGIGCERIEVYRGAQPNRWVLDMRRFETLRERAFELIRIGDALIALPGGVGTLSEIAMSWSLLQTGEIEPKPLIVLGPLWKSMLSEFEHGAHGYYQGDDLDLISYAADIGEVIDVLSQSRGSPDKRGGVIDE